MSPRGTAAVAGWLSRRSLRFRVSAAATAFVAFALVLAAAGLVFGHRAAAKDGVDAAAEQRAADVAALVATGKQPAVLPGAAVSATVVQVLDAHGSVLASTEELPTDRALLPLPLPPELEGANPATIPGLPVPGGDRRVVALQVPAPAGPVTVVAATSPADADVVVASLVTGLLAGVPALVAVVGLTTWVLAGYTLRPVEALRSQAAEITANGLHRRLAQPPARDEVHRLAVTLNAMLGRLQAGAAMQRAFVADAAHELRSPLAAIRAQLDVARAHPTALDAGRLPMLLEDDAARLQDLVDDLVLLARGDDPSWRPPRHQVVDLDDLVLADVRRVTATRAAVLDAGGVSAGRVLGEPAGLRRVVRNLLDNAARHGSHVRVVLRRDAREVVLVVADDGPGVPAEQRSRVFDRFARLDSGRSRDGGGVGLGLAIVAQVVQAHHGSVAVDQDDPPPAGLGGARFTVRLPAGP